MLLEKPRFNGVTKGDVTHVMLTWACLSIIVITTDANLVKHIRATVTD